MKYLTTILFLISVTLLNAQTDSATLAVFVQDNFNKPIKGEQILFESIKTKQTFKGISFANGKFNIKLPGNDTYLIKLKSIGEAQDYNKITIPPLAANERYGINELTLTITESKTFTLDNVYFDSGKATLKNESFKELNELYEYLMLKPTINIEIGGHTDNVGNEINNQKLSELRANVVKDYLVNKGIKASRIKAVGYGETRPVASNETSQGRQQNRRTEVRIL